MLVEERTSSRRGILTDCRGTMAVGCDVWSRIMTVAYGGSRRDLSRLERTRRQGPWHEPRWRAEIEARAVLDHDGCRNREDDAASTDSQSSLPEREARDAEPKPQHEDSSQILHRRKRRTQLDQLRIPRNPPEDDRRAGSLHGDAAGEHEQRYSAIDSRSTLRGVRDRPADRPVLFGLVTRLLRILSDIRATCHQGEAMSKVTATVG
jgi:hypothetical protein